MQIIELPIDKLTFDPANARRHDNANIDAIKGSLSRFGQQKPIVVNEQHIVVAGNGTLAAARALGYKTIKAVVTTLPRLDERAFALADNRTAELAAWDDEALLSSLKALELEGFNIGEIGFSDDYLKVLNFNNADTGDGSLANDFIVPPFTVLDARQGYWQERKKHWLSLGIQSEVGRERGLIKGSVALTAESNKDSSIFDPVLCELMYKWFSPAGGKVLDPFAGGSVRGLVAAMCGYEYTGIDLRAEQVDANRAQASDVCKDKTPQWICGDSEDIPSLVRSHEAQFDFIFSCPPYADLEVYSDDPQDLSTMPYDTFLQHYESIIGKACSFLKPNRFACFVVGDVRDEAGNYRDFVSATIHAFKLAGLNLYNEAILVTAVGSLPVRAARYMRSRKLGKTHQNVLVFVKGNGEAAAKECGEIVLDTDVGN